MRLGLMAHMYHLPEHAIERHCGRVAVSPSLPSSLPGSCAFLALVPHSIRVPPRWLITHSSLLLRLGAPDSNRVFALASKCFINLSPRMTTVRHYETGSFPKERAPVRLSDEAYGLALDAIVKACVDVVLVHRDSKKVLLGNRRVQPQPGLWFIGGRMIPGESPEETAARHVKHDTKLAIAPSAFSFVTVSSYVWALRHQPPAVNGTADIALTYFCLIGDEEAGLIDCGNSDECGRATLSLVLAPFASAPLCPQLTKAKLAPENACVCGTAAPRRYAGEAFQWHDLLSVVGRGDIHPALRDALIKLATLVL